MKPGFMLYHTDLHAIEDLSAEEFKALILALLRLSEFGEVSRLNGPANTAYHFMAEKVIRDQEKYNGICEKNREKGRKSAAMRQNNHANNQPQSTTVDNGQLLQPTVTETATVAETATVTVNENEVKSRAKRFTPPSLDEVIAYCRERHNNIDAQRFIDFYEGKGWMVGKNKMKDWKACVRTWENRDGRQQQDSRPIRFVD